MATKIPAPDWPRFYAALGRYSVAMPSLAPGDAIDRSELASLLVTVQTRRDALARTGIRLQQSIGELKRQVEITNGMARLHRVEAESDPAALNLKGRARAAFVDGCAQRSLSQASLLKSRLAEYEAAYSAVKMQADAMETAKQTLNALVKLAAGEEPRARW